MDDLAHLLEAILILNRHVEVVPCVCQAAPCDISIYTCGAWPDKSLSQNLIPEELLQCVVSLSLEWMLTSTLLLGKSLELYNMAEYEMTTNIVQAATCKYRSPAADHVWPIFEVAHGLRFAFMTHDVSVVAPDQGQHT